MYTLKQIARYKQQNTLSNVQAPLTTVLARLKQTRLLQPNDSPKFLLFKYTVGKQVVNRPPGLQKL